jgi:hypothetical protein
MQSYPAVPRLVGAGKTSDLGTEDHHLPALQAPDGEIAGPRRREVGHGEGLRRCRDSECTHRLEHHSCPSSDADRSQQGATSDQVPLPGLVPSVRTG